MKRVLVTGATGNVGRQVVEQLRGTACRIRALSRNPHSANLPHDVSLRAGLGRKRMQGLRIDTVELGTTYDERAHRDR